MSGARDGWTCCAFVLCVAGLLLGTTPSSHASEEQLAEFAARDTLVALDDVKLHFQIIDGEGPIVLLEAGGGLDAAEWKGLAPELARETGATIVSYDRAGFGSSSLPEVGHDMSLETEWLWNALSLLGLNKNLILVGHSFGGWMIRIEADRFAGAVSGLVFVDPFSAEFVSSLGVAYCDSHPMMGNLPFADEDPSTLSAEQRALVRMVGEGLGPKMETMRDTQVPEGIPVRILTSAKPFLPKPQEQSAWREAHEAMAASITGSVLIVAEESGHMIPWNQPDLIIESVKDVVAAIR